MTITIRPLTDEDAPAWANLLAISFARQPQQMLQLWTWFQAMRRLVVWGAWDGSQLIAQYSCLQAALQIPEWHQPVYVGISTNMAVHPAYRGRGLIKQVSTPVYETLLSQGGLAGVGFSNAAGVKVDKRSKGYGYQVVGKMMSKAVWLFADNGSPPLSLMDTWPTLPWSSTPCADAFIRFHVSPEFVRTRFMAHPFRRYRFGVWLENGRIMGLVVYRLVTIGGLQGASLLAAYASDLLELLARWRTAVRRMGVRFVHFLTTPASNCLLAMEQLGFCRSLPYTRSPYYLTVKPLSEAMPETLLDFARWDCLGSDIL